MPSDDAETRAAPPAAPRRRGPLWRLGLGLRAWILARADRAAILAALRAADPAWLALGFAAPLPAILPRVWRWRLLLGEGSRGWSFRALTALDARAIALGVVTPGRVGELARAAPIAAAGGGLAPALASVLADRLADLLLLAALGLVATAHWTLPDALATGVRAGALLLVGGSLAATVWLVRGGLERFADRLPGELRRLPRLGAGAAGAVAALTALSWAVTYVAGWAYARALGLPLGYVELALVSALCSLVASLPISIAGAGTRDATLLLVLGGLGIARPDILALAALMLANALFVGGVCALAFLLRPPARAAVAGETG